MARVKLTTTVRQSVEVKYLRARCGVALPKNAPRALLSWAADRICGHPIVARNLAGFASMRGHEDADRDGGVLAAERGAS
jgi:hypothetical protein